MSQISQVEQLAAAAGGQPREGDLPQRAGRGHWRRQEFLHGAGRGHPLQSEDSKLGGRSGGITFYHVSSTQSD